MITLFLLFSSFFPPDLPAPAPRRECMAPAGFVPPCIGIVRDVSQNEPAMAASRARGRARL